MRAGELKDFTILAIGSTSPGTSRLSQRLLRFTTFDILSLSTRIAPAVQLYLYFTYTDARVKCT